MQTSYKPLPYRYLFPTPLTRAARHALGADLTRFARCPTKLIDINEEMRNELGTRALVMGLSKCRRPRLRAPLADIVHNLNALNIEY